MNHTDEILDDETILTEVKPSQSLLADPLLQQVIGKSQVIYDPPTVPLSFSKHNPLTDEFTGLEKFFKRRIRIDSGNFATTDANTGVGAFYYSYDLWSKIYNASAFNGKFGGYQAFKLSGKVIVQVNATPFQIGRYGVAILNNFSQVNKLGPYPNSVLRNAATLTQRTTLPNVEIDINKTSLVEIPFDVLVPTEYFNISVGTTIAFEPVYAILFCVQPLLNGPSSTTTVASYEVYVQITDFKTLGTGHFQSSKGKNITDKESVMKGPITAVLTNVSKTLGILGRIPVLSTFTAPSKFVADVLADATNIWGWSAPTSTANPCQKMVRSRYDGFSASDKMKNAVMVGTVSTNSIQSDPVTGTGVDEMSLPFIASKVAWMSNFTWSTGQAAGTNRYGSIVCPLFTNYTYGTSTVYTGPPFAVTAMWFKYWRGTIKFHIKLNKTQFHAGRLIVYYQPPDSGYTTSINPTASTQEYYDKFIWDITAGDEITFCIPHMNLKDWLMVNSGITSQTNGALRIDVLDALLCPETVSSTITASVYMSAGDDFLLSYPTTLSTLYPVSTASLQGMDTQSQVGCIGFGASAPDRSYKSTALSTGEHYQSVRPLLKVYFRNDNIGAPHTCLNINPWIIDTNYIGAVSTIATSTQNDCYSFFGHMYGALRGSMRIANLNPDSTGMSIVNMVDYNSYGGITIQSSVFGVAGTDPQVGVPCPAVAREGGVEWQIPYVNNVPYTSSLGVTVCSVAANPFYTVAGCLSPTGASAALALNDMPTCAPRFYNYGGTGTPWWFRAVGDDFSFHHLLSAPMFTLVKPA